MAKVENIIEEGESIFDNSETAFLKSVKGTEKFVYDELIKILNTLDISNGKLKTNSNAENFLMGLDKKIYDALKKAGYDESVLKYTRNFKDIANNTKELQKALNGIVVEEASITPILNIEVQNTIDRLAGSGLAKDFVNPVRQSLYRNIMFGADVTEVEKTLKEFVISTGDSESKLLRYAKQVSRDSMQQFDGALQQNIAIDMELNAVRYVGSLITDSRAQCRRWVKMGVILNEDLQSEIDWAFDHGSGMNPDTTPETFNIYRGGFSCRHKSIPTNKK